MASCKQCDPTVLLSLLLVIHFQLQVLVSMILLLLALLLVNLPVHPEVSALLVVVVVVVVVVTVMAVVVVTVMAVVVAMVLLKAAPVLDHPVMVVIISIPVPVCEPIISKKYIKIKNKIYKTIGGYDWSFFLFFSITYLNFVVLSPLYFFFHSLLFMSNS
jgi:hypothetical protein